MIGPPSHYFLVKQFAVEARTVGIGIILKQRYIEELWTERRATRMTGLVTKCRRIPRGWRSAGRRRPRLRIDQKMHICGRQM